MLDCTGTRQALQRSPLHWREALRQVMGDVVA
jgi:hypothetical protein